MRIKIFIVHTNNHKILVKSLFIYLHDTRVHSNKCPKWDTSAFVRHSVLLLWLSCDNYFPLRTILSAWACTFYLSFSPYSSSQHRHLHRLTTKLLWNQVQTTHLRLPLSPHLRIYLPSNLLRPFSIHMLANLNWAPCFLNWTPSWAFLCPRIKQSWLCRENRQFFLSSWYDFSLIELTVVNTDMKGQKNKMGLKSQNRNTMKKRRKTWKVGYLFIYFRSVCPYCCLLQAHLLTRDIPEISSLFRCTGSSDPPPV